MEKWIFLLLLVIVFGNLTSVAFSVSAPICSPRSVKDYTFESRDPTCPLSDESHVRLAVTEGDERWLQTALDMIHKNKCDHVALLFYASWCPFSTSFRPTFHVISSLYSSIPHFAIKESSVKPSTLSKYGVYGFPTLLLVNSTMMARYRGTRLLDSLVTFYTDVTGIETLDKTSMEKSVPVPSHLGNEDNTEPENCPFTWAKSPESLIRQETCLALAVVFVLLRLLYLVYPALVVLMKYTWRRIAYSMRQERLQEHTVGFLSRAVQFCMHLIEPGKRRNLQRAWNS